MISVMNARAPDPREDDDGIYPPPVYESDGEPVAEDATQRIEEAKEAARRRRRELGLPDLPADELGLPKRGNKAGKRWKKHGQFMRPGSKP